LVLLANSISEQNKHIGNFLLTQPFYMLNDSNCKVYSGVMINI